MPLPASSIVSTTASPFVARSRMRRICAVGPPVSTARSGTVAARARVLGIFAGKQAAAVQGGPSQNNGDDENGGACPFLSKPNRGPQDERQWQKEDGGKEAGGR